MVDVRRAPWWVAAPPAVLALAVGLFRIGRHGLFNDEYATWYASTLPLRDLARLLDHQDALLGPHYLAMHVWIELAGIEPGHLRAPSAAAMAVAAGLIALVGRRLIGPWPGLAAGLAFAVLPSTSAYAQEARPYAFAVAFVLLATLLLLRAMDEPSGRRWAAYGVAVLLVALSHVVAVLVLAAHAVLVWWAPSSNRRSLRRGWVLSTGAALLAVLPLVLKGSTQTFAIEWIVATPRAVRELPARLFGSDTAMLVVVVLAIVGVAVLVRSTPRVGGVLLVWALVPPLFCLATAPALHLFLDRYLLFTVPAWLLLAAGLLRAAGRPVAPAAALALALAVGLAGLPDQEQARRLSTIEPDFDRAARIVDAGLREGDGIVFVSTRRDARRAFAYLHAIGVVGPTRDVLLGRSAQELGWVRGTECDDPARCLTGVDRVWLVTEEPPVRTRVEPLSAGARQVLEDEFDAETVGRARQLRVELLQRP